MNILKRFWPIFTLIAIEMLLFLTTYKPGTYLIGWDSIMPEFNIPLNFSRSLFGVWQNYRGLGYPDGMSQVANIIHTAYIFLLSFVFPQNMLRYVFISLTHLAGGIGMYFLAKELLLKNKSQYLNHKSQINSNYQNQEFSNLLPFFAAFFYMVNLGVVQMYFAPLEAFAIHFAALPILSYVLIKALESHSKKSLFMLVLTSILLVSQAFVPTIFFVSLILFSLIILISTWQTKRIKRGIGVFLILIISNLFWMLPYLYNGVHNAAIIQNSKINQFSSEEVFFRNLARGDFMSVISFKGFMIDTVEYDSLHKGSIFFMGAWRNYANTIGYDFLSLLLFTGLLVGIYSIFKQKHYYMLPFLITCGISFVFLANNTPGVGLFTVLMRTVLPVAGEVFRFPFTKFITIFAFTYILILISGIHYLGQKIRTFSYQGKRVGERALIGFFVGLVVLMSLPVWTGNFISPLLKQKLPADYTEVFSYMNNQDENARVALLPIHTFWNWQYRDWGYRGSDFLWYGIKQPILLRPFDPWSNYNEQFYNELAYALNTQNTERFEDVLKKYNVSYLLLDAHILNTLASQPINYDALKGFLSKSDLIHPEKSFGKITLYKTNLPVEAGYKLSPDTVSLAPEFSFEKEDVGRKEVGNYTTSNHPDVSYLFPSLYTEKLQKDIEFTVTNRPTSLEFTNNHLNNFDISGKFLEIPSLFTYELLIPVKIEKNSTQIILYPLTPTVYINNQEITGLSEPIVLTPKTVTNPQSLTVTDLKETVKGVETGKTFYLMNNYQNSLKLSDGIHQEIITVDTTNHPQNSFITELNDPKITSIRVSVPKIPSFLNSENVIEEQLYTLEKKNTVVNPYPQEAKNIQIEGQNRVDIQVKSAATELSFYKDDLPHAAAYIAFVKSQYKSGLPIQFYVDNPFQKRPEVEAVFSKTGSENVLVIPPSEPYFSGYGFHFTVKSVGLEDAHSTIEQISLYPFPYETLKHMRIVGDQTPQVHTDIISLNTEKRSDFAYTARLPLGKSLVVLSQAYNPDWKAYEIKIKDQKSKIKNYFMRYFPFVFGKEIKDHRKVNNWENGWMVDSKNDGEVVIVFMPQYLEFIGLIALGGMVGYLLLYREKKSE